MKPEEYDAALAERMGVKLAAWKLIGGKGDNGAGASLNNKLGITVWDNGWTDGVRFPLATPGMVTDDEWAAAIAELLAKRPQSDGDDWASAAQATLTPPDGYVYTKNAPGRIEASVWTVTVVREDGMDFHVFSTEALAKAFADDRPEPCVIADYVVDAPERYYGASQ